MPDVKKERVPQSINSVKKAYTILRAFSYERPRLRLKDISEITRMSPASAHRFLNTMKEIGFIEQRDGSYALGKAFLELTGIVLYSMEVRQHALPYLDEVAAKTKAMANLAVLDGAEVIYIARAESPDSSWGYFHIGMKRPAYCTALGKVLLSHLAEADLQRVLSQDLKSYTRHTLVDKEKLVEQLKQVKLQGYATDFEEWSNGLNCLATPIYSAGGVCVAAISLSGPTSTFTVERAKESIPVLVETAGRISGRLGYTQGLY